MEWISVKDRLPEEGIYVLTLDSGSKDGCSEYRLDYIVDVFEEEGMSGTPEKIWGCRLMDDYVKVTHWMPLPKPPSSDA